MNVELSTKTSRIIEREEISSTKEKLIHSKTKSKKKSSEAAATSQVTGFQNISYQRDPSFIQFLFEETIVPLVEDLTKLGIVKKVFSPEEQKSIQDVTANSRLYALLKGIAEQSIALRMQTLQLAILKVNTINPDENGTRRTNLANMAVEYCVKRLIKSTEINNNSENVWSSEEGKQFFVDLSLLSELYGIPIPVLLYKLETAAYQDPRLQKFITSTTYPQYKRMAKIVYEHKGNINNETERAVIKEAGPYFSDALKDAYTLFSLGLDKSLQNLSADLKNAHLFRKNTVATVHVMKKAERMKHLIFLKELPKKHLVEPKSIFIDQIEYTLTIAKEIKTNLVKVMTLNKKNSEDVDVYLFVQIVKDPHTNPDPVKALHLVKFEITKGTNLIWIKEADNTTKEFIINEFEEHKYKPSVYTAIKFKNEIILVEIFKQSGISLNSRTRAGTIDTYVETLGPKYDDEIKEDLINILEDSLGGPINQYLSKCYHNDDLDLMVHAAPVDQKFMKNLAKQSVAHIEKVAKNSWRKKEYPFKWVKKSILAAIYDDPNNPIDAGNHGLLAKKAEKINLQVLQGLLKSASKKKNSDVPLLGTVEIISESISYAFNSSKKEEAVIKMLEHNFKKESLDDIFNVTSSDPKDALTGRKGTITEKKVEAIFKKLLLEWNLKFTEKQLDLIDKFFKRYAS